MSRRTARENLFKLIYERLVTDERNALTFNIFFESIEDAQKDYFTLCYEGIDKNFSFLQEVIGSYSKDFAIGRVYKVDLAILIIASYEIVFVDDIPDVAAINEALELAKIYSTPKSSTFINGVLASVKRNKEEIFKNASEIN